MKAEFFHSDLEDFFLSTGVCTILGLDNILAAMSLGFFMVNFAPAKTRPIFSLVEKFTPPIYVLFFCACRRKTEYLGCYTNLGNSCNFLCCRKNFRKIHRRASWRKDNKSSADSPRFFAMVSFKPSRSRNRT